MKIWNGIFNDHYFEAKPFEKDGQLYERMGIKTFKKIVMVQVRNNKVKNYNLMEYSIKGLMDFERISRRSEKAHTMIGTVMLIYAVFMCFFINDLFDVFFILLILLVNIVVNGYPICLQRYNRIRINRLLNTMKSRNKFDYG